VSFTTQASYNRTYAPNQSKTYDKREDNPIAHAMAVPINMQPMSVWKEADTWYNGWEGMIQNTPYLKYPEQDRTDYYLANGKDKIGKNNAYHVTNNIIRTHTTDRFFGKLQMDWKLADPLTFTLRSGMNSRNFVLERKVPYGSERKESGYYEYRESNSLGINSDALLAYNNMFLNDKLSVDGLIGGNYSFNESTSLGFQGGDLATPNAFSLSALPSHIRPSVERRYPTRKYSVFATATFGWNNMLYLDVSGRNDWAGILDHELDSKFYPGASLAWLASEAVDFGDWMSLLKFRAGYATTGHGIGMPINLDSYALSENTWDGVKMGTVGGNLIDPNLKPELSITKEIGLDFGLYNNRVLGEFTAYQKEHINQIQQLPVVSSSGFSSMTTNMGSVTSKGIEASLTVIPVRNNDWEWSLTGNLTTNVTEITELDDLFESQLVKYEASVKINLEEGARVGDIYAEKPLPRIQQGKYEGMLLNSYDGIVDMAVRDDEYVKKHGYLGNINPDAIFGFNTNVKYKNWSFGAVTSLRMGGIYMSETQKILIDDGMADISEIYKDNYDEYWTGGRFAGGLESMPDPSEMFVGYEDEDGINFLQDHLMGEMSYYNGDPRYYGYWNSVFIDPRVDISDLTPEERLQLSDDKYIVNGEDPNATLYVRPYNMEGEELWSGAQLRTWDATSFKIKEVNISYTLDKAIAKKILCQSATVTAFAKNVAFWAKNPMGEDPETAYRNGIKSMGIAYFSLPPIRTMGLKLSLNF
jgi:hypothetical protein